MTGDRRVVDYLREARADELALARTLRARIAAAPRGEYRSGLQRYMRETQGHARRIGGRLDELDAGEGPLRSGARALLDATAGMLSISRPPLKAVARDEKTLRGSQFGCATQGLVIATYTALEMVAERAGDRETARLAAEIRTDEQHMLEWLRHEIVKLTDPFIREQLEAGWPQHDELSVDEVQRAIERAEHGHANRL